jgi:hypothetical protein
MFSNVSFHDMTVVINGPSLLFDVVFDYDAHLELYNSTCSAPYCNSSALTITEIHAITGDVVLNDASSMTVDGDLFIGRGVNIGETAATDNFRGILSTIYITSKGSLSLIKTDEPHYEVVLNSFIEVIGSIALSDLTTLTLNKVCDH